MRGRRRSKRLVTAAVVGIAAAASFRRLLRPRQLDLRGRVVAITGGSRGLGLLLAEEFGRRGARVAIAGRDEEAVRRAEDRLRALGVDVHARACDLGERAGAEAFIDGVLRELGRLDVLVNNAGVIQVAPLRDTPVESIEEAMRSNFWSTVYTTMRALPELVKRGRDARIVNVVSIGGRVAVPHLVGYNASKFAQMGFSQSLQAELARSGVRITTVVPGPMRTGSIYNAEFGGAPPREFSWFGLVSSVPVATIGATRAAKRIVTAALEGRPEVRLGLSAHAMTWLSGVAPRFTGRLMRWLNAVLPPPAARDAAQRPRRGRDVRAPLQRSTLLELANRAARRNNEAPPGEAR